MGDVAPSDPADIASRVDRRDMADARRQLLRYRRRGARGFTASASRIDPADTKQVEAAKRRRAAWTTEAWNYFDCLDSITEILTEDGWRTHDAVEAGTIVLTLNAQTGEGEWQPVEEMRRHEVTDEPMLSMESRAHSSLSTLNHRWPVLSYHHRHEWDGTIDWTTSAELSYKHRLIQSAPTVAPSEAKWSDDFVELVAWFWTEGTIVRNSSGGSPRVTLYQSATVNPAWCARIRSALSSMFGPGLPTLGAGRIRSEPAWTEWMSDAGIVHFKLNVTASEQFLAVAPEKIVSPEFIRQLTRAQLTLFVETSIDADGHRREGNGAIIGQRQEVMLDALELACILLGRGTRRSYWPNGSKSGDPDRWALSIRSKHSVIAPAKTRSAIVSYTGTIWCPKTANKSWLARRNGCVYYTGNTVGEAKYGARFKGRALAKLRLFPAWLDDSGRPVPLEEAQADGAPITDEEIAVCHAAIDRMAAADGSHYPILYSYGVTMFVAGDGYLAGFPNEDGVETWGFYSTDELHPGTTGMSEWVITPSPDANMDDQIPVPADALVLRMWQQHPRFSAWADSALRGVLDVCQEISWLTRLSVGNAQSRLAAGMMIFPDTMLGHTEREVDGTADGEAQNNPFVDDLLRHTETAIQRPDSAEAAVPFFTFADAEDIAAIRQFEFGNTMDDTLIPRMKLARERFAAGVDLPPAIILGIGDTNHWNAWSITEDTFNMHVEPDAIEFVSGATAGYYRPALLAARLNPATVKRMAMWYDETDLVTKPNLGDAADDAWDRITISDAAYRQTKGFADSSAPDDDEYRRRAFLKTGEVVLKEEDLNVAIPTEPTAPVAPVEAIPTPGAEEGTPSEPGPPPMVAAAGPSQAERLTAAALRWQALDRVLAAKLLTLANTALRRSLEKAGARLRSRVAKDRSSPAADVARNTSNALLAATLGPGLVAAVVDPPDLLDSFDELGVEFDRLTSRVQAQVRRDLASILEWSDDDALPLIERQDNDRRLGAAAFVSGVATIAAVRLFDPSPNAPPLGEVDVDSLVPPGIVRQAMAVAGGSPAELTPSYSVFVPGGVLPGELDTIRPSFGKADPIILPPSAITDPATGVAQGLSSFDTISVALPTLQYRYRWNYGDEGERTRPFEPHVALDGIEFSSWEDPQLSNPDAFPDDAFYRPGDHAGDLCDFEVIFVEPTGDEEAPGALIEEKPGL